LLGGRYSASSLLRTPPPPSPLRSLSRVLRLYDLPCSAAFTTGGGGFLQLLRASLSPCCRSHPAGVGHRVSQPTMLHAAFALSVAGSASRALHFRGHLCVCLRCGPVTRGHPYDDLCRWASGHWFPSSLPSELQGFWLLPRRDCLPLNAPAFAGRTTVREVLPHTAYRQSARMQYSSRMRSPHQTRTLRPEQRKSPCSRHHSSGGLRKARLVRCCLRRSQR
jgi:hypothetical protein